MGKCVLCCAGVCQTGVIQVSLLTQDVSSLEIRLFSACLVLEFKVHRTSIWERRMDVQWGRTDWKPEQGRSKALSVLLPLTLAVSMSCKTGPLLWSQPHTVGPGGQDSWSLEEGGGVAAVSHQWGRWGDQRVQAAGVLPDVLLRLQPLPAAR